MNWQTTLLLQRRRYSDPTNLPILLLVIVLLSMLWPFATTLADETHQSTPPISVLIDNLSYDEAIDEYHFTVSIAWPNEINQLHVTIEEAEGGKQIFGFALGVNGRNALQSTFKGTELREGRAYLITIQGTDFANHRLMRPAENGMDSTAERVILASHPFTHEPQKTVGLPVKILSVNVEYDQLRILIMLELQDAELARLEQYTGYIKNKETGAQVHTIERQLFHGQPLIEPLPLSMQNPVEAQSYELILTLITREDLLTSNEEAYEFTPPLPERPSRWARIVQALSTPWLIMGIVVILVSTGSWLILQSRRQKNLDSLPPPIDQTGRYQPYKPTAHEKRQHRARISLRSTVDKNVVIDELFTEFPITIGREGCTINIPGDRLISRKHLQIDHHQGALALFDLNSVNGTSVANAPVIPGKPWALKNTSDVTLGHHTEIRIEVLN